MIVVLIPYCMTSRREYNSYADKIANIHFIRFVRNINIPVTICVHCKFKNIHNLAVMRKMTRPNATAKVIAGYFQRIAKVAKIASLQKGYVLTEREGDERYVRSFGKLQK